MSKVYFHDAESRTVIAAPAEPDVREKKDRRGGFDGWFVSATLEITRADNYLKPGTHQWAFRVREPHSERYFARDTREAAIGYFKASKYPQCLEISAAEYARLRAEYEQQANRNKPPAT